MKKTKVLFEGELYYIKHDYKNGQLEIQRENAMLYYEEIKLVYKHEIEFLSENDDSPRQCDNL